MKNAYIKFYSDEECDLGCQQLVAHSPVSRLSNGIFCIPWSSLALLDACQISYSFASASDLIHAHPIWNFASPKTT